MARSYESDVHRRRRWFVALAAAVAFHASLGLLPLPRFSGTWGVRGGDGGGAARGLQTRFATGALQGTEVTVLSPPSAVAAPQPPNRPPQPPVHDPEPEIAVPEEATSEPEPTPSHPNTGTHEALPATGAAGAPGDPSPGEAPGDAVSGHGNRGGGIVPRGPIELELGTPRLWVHPVMPEVVRKRKIRDDVILQLLVGTDGLVRDVRVLRAIPNCEECTRNAIAAARRHRYEAVSLDGRPVEVWTTSTFTFTYGN